MTKMKWTAPVLAVALSGLLASPAQAAQTGETVEAKAGQIRLAERVSPGPEGDYQVACANAEAARKAAADARYVWNTTAPLIKKAHEAAKGGDHAKAVKLCGEAQKQGELALAQAKRESEDWKAEAALVK